MFKVSSSLSELCLDVASASLDATGVFVASCNSVVNKLSPTKSTSTVATVATVSSCSSLASSNGAINTPTDEDCEFCDMTREEYDESLKKSNEESDEESNEEIDDDYDFVLASECKTESTELEMATICRISS